MPSDAADGKRRRRLMPQARQQPTTELPPRRLIPTLRLLSDPISAETAPRIIPVTSSSARSTATMEPDTPVGAEPQPSIFRWILGFLLVGACWGLTTPFMRKAAMSVCILLPKRPELILVGTTRLHSDLHSRIQTTRGSRRRCWAYGMPSLEHCRGQHMRCPSC
jgi:hypothetical protein